MSLTESHEVFAGIHEDALNDLVTAFCTDRPRYLVYGSPAFAPVTTVAETAMAAIAFPGVPGGIQWRVQLSIPLIDLHKQTASLPPELTLGPGQFSASLRVRLCIDCRRLKIDPRPPREKPGATHDRAPATHGHDRPPNHTHPDDVRPPRHVELTCCSLTVFAVGHLEHVLTSSGEDAVVLAVDAVEIVDIAPAALEAVIECLLFMILQAVLAEIRLPLRALRVGAFSLSLTQGPLIEDDQIKMRGVV
jgi:hypothetical protein